MPRRRRQGRLESLKPDPDEQATSQEGGYEFADKLLDMLEKSHKRSLKSLKKQLRKEIKTNRRWVKGGVVISVVGVVLGAFGIWLNF